MKHHGFLTFTISTFTVFRQDPIHGRLELIIVYQSKAAKAYFFRCLLVKDSENLLDVFLIGPIFEMSGPEVVSDSEIFIQLFCLRNPWQFC